MTDRSWRTLHVREHANDGKPHGLWRHVTAGPQMWGPPRDPEEPSGFCGKRSTLA